MLQQKTIEELADDAKKNTPPQPPALQVRLTKNTWGLLQVSPNNPSVRAMVLAELKRPIPDDHDTLEKICEWYLSIEKDLAPPPPPKPLPVFKMDMQYCKREFGTCKFSHTKSYGGAYSVDAERVKDIVEGSDDFDAAVEMLREFLEEDVQQYAQISRQRHTEYEPDHEQTDYDVNSIQNTDTMVRLENWIKNNLPEDAERFGL